MTDQAIVQDPVVPVPVEKTYTYQPTDENGNNLGGLQVVKYDGTPEDLGKKMAEQNNELIKLNRRLKKDLRLGNITKEEIPQDAPRFDESKFQLVPQPLTAEERIQLATDINDPEKLDYVADRFVRAKIGDPEALRTRLARLEQKAAKSDALEEAQAFKNSNPDYYVCTENFQTMANWMVKNGLEPVKENFQLAYDTLKEYMTPKPVPVVSAPVVVPDPPPVQRTDAMVPSVIAPNTPARPVSSGLTRSNGSDTGPAPKSGYSLAEIDKMSGEDYKRLVLVPEFKKQQQAGRA